MKRFLVFSFQSYRARGGFEDFVSAHDTVESAIDAARDAIQPEHGIDCSHVVDLETLNIMWEK